MSSTASCTTHQVGHGSHRHTLVELCKRSARCRRVRSWPGRSRRSPRRARSDHLREPISASTGGSPRCSIAVPSYFPERAEASASAALCERRVEMRPQARGRSRSAMLEQRVRVRQQRLVVEKGAGDEQRSEAHRHERGTRPPLCTPAAPAESAGITAVADRVQCLLVDERLLDQRDPGEPLLPRIRW